MKKRILTYILITSLLIYEVVLFSANNGGISVENSQNKKDKAIESLITTGWTLSEINSYLDDIELLRYSNGSSDDIKTTEGFLKFESEKRETINYDQANKTYTKEFQKAEGTDRVINLTEYQFYSETSQINENVSYTTDGFLKYSLQAIYLGDSTYNISLRFQWYRNPASRLTDTIALMHGDNLVQTGNYTTVSYMYQEEWQDTNGLSGINQYSSYKKCLIDASGTKIMFNLSNDILMDGYAMFFSNQRGYISYNVVLKYPNITNQSTQISGYYSHQKFIFDLIPSTIYQFDLLKINN